MNAPHQWNPDFSRREFLRRCGMGMGTLALMDLMTQTGIAAETPMRGSRNPLAPKRPPFMPKAKRIIHLFMNGGVSQVDTFDPKPALNIDAGKSLPVKNPETERKTGAAFPSPFTFRKY